MSRIIETTVGQLVVNFDRMRKPLSSLERQSRKGPYPYYGATCIFDYIDDYIFDGDYILLGEDGTVINADGSPVLQRISGKTWVNNHAHVLRNTSKIDFDYLYYALMNTNFSSAVTGAVQPKISQANMNAVPISIHEDIGEQKAIAQYLLSIDRAIDLNKAVNQKLLEQAQLILLSFFVDFNHFDGTMPSNWEYGTLGDIVDFINGYAFKSKELLDAPEGNCYQVFKQGHINRGGGFNADGTKSWYPISKCNGLQKYILRKGDVLMAMTDMKDNVAILGNTALMPVDNQYIVNQRVGLLRSNGYMNTSYAYIYLLTNSSTFLKDLRNRANSGVQVNLSSAEIKNSSVLIASKDVNAEFNNLTKPLLDMIMVNELKNKQLAQLRNALLPKLMSGEISVLQ